MYTIDITSQGCRVLELTNVSKIYGKKDNVFTALDDVSVTIPDEAVVAIVGKSGSGKSTLMHIMSGLDHPTNGEVIVNGKSLKGMKRKELDAFRSKEMSFIFQSFFVQGNDNCYDNVALPLEIAELDIKKRHDAVYGALKAVELEDKVKQKAKDLSGGQKQRLAIARSIVNQPSIIFADEPTGNLDSATGAVGEKLLFDYAREHKATLIIVTHDQDLADKCNMQVHIKDGRIERIDETKSAESQGN